MVQDSAVPLRAVIVSLYRGLLGREPDGAEIDHHIARVAETDLAAVIGSFAGSAEFNRIVDAQPPGFVAMNYEAGGPVQTHLPDGELDRIWTHIAEVWAGLGDTDPLWSVITDEQLRTGRVQDPARLDRFYAAGEGDVQYLKAFLQRAGREVHDFPTVVEYGCGVGRVTAWLAREFETVRGYDISPSHAAAARTYLAERHIENVSVHLVRTRADLSGLTGFDLFFSLIVLQHNPPPIILDILKHAFEGLNPNGLAVFQVPTHDRGYRFALAEYWDGVAARRDMEMHAVPQRDILVLADRCGLVPLEIRNDHCIGRYAEAISSTFVLQKR